MNLSFVGKKANRQWVWIAMDATTRQVIAFHVGDRSGQSVQTLWEKIPAVYQQHAVFIQIIMPLTKVLFPLACLLSRSLVGHAAGRRPL